MIFHLDDQTIQDLELFKNNASQNSIFDIFNQVKTFGGRVRLLDMMKSPINEKVLLQRRVESIQYFFQNNLKQDISNQQFDFINHYLNSNWVILKNNKVDIAAQKIKNSISSDKGFYVISTGIQYVFFALKNLFLFVEKLEDETLPFYLKKLKTQILDFKNLKEIQSVLQQVDLTKRENEIKITTAEIFQFDKLFRKIQRENLETIIQIIFEFDVFTAVAKTAKKLQFTFPNYLDSEKCKFEMEGLFHPLLDDPIRNDFLIDEKNICFLTGPNMAGKSTLLKSISLSIYLSHIGFPVPARRFSTTIFNGMMTTINLSDNIDLGFSHFLNEVKRVKEAALKIKNGDKFFIVFDELFRGTNVKDAYEASVLIIRAFAKIKRCAFIISTHLIEIANEIRDCENISFQYLETELKGNEIEFSYKIKEGISKDRIGIIIVKNEGILDILNDISND